VLLELHATLKPRGVLFSLAEAKIVCDQKCLLLNSGSKRPRKKRALQKMHHRLGNRSKVGNPSGI
jgi:hypothetical protein